MMDALASTRTAVRSRIRDLSSSGEAITPRAVEQLATFVAPGSVAADQYRALRYSLEALRSPTEPSVFAITSPSPGDGKTLTVLNLAGAFAQSANARVLVIDADLRKPSIAAYLGLGRGPTPGLTDALCNSDYDLRDIAYPIEGFNLAIVPSGRPAPSPYDLLDSPRFEALLREARQQYDRVLIDTPPAVVLPDCRLIARCIDGFVIVVAAHKTPRTLLTETLNQFEPSKLLGLVFNADDRRSARYYGYYGLGAQASPPWWRRLFETL